MANTQFWLVTLYETTVSVHLVQTTSTNDVKVIATGLTQHWQGQVDSLVSAVDVSLSGCAQLLNLPPDHEPDQVAFILSPFWVSSDGRILEEKKHLIEQVCRQLKLKPMGFTPYDESLAEYLSGQEGVPVNLVITHFFPQEIICTHISQGRVTNRYRHPISSPEEISPRTMEMLFNKLKGETTLPSELVLVGDTPLNTLEQFLRHPWTSQRNPQLFLHLPTIKKYNNGQITQIYAEFIVSNTGFEASKLPQASPPIVNENLMSVEVEQETLPLEIVESQVEEVDPSLLGFGTISKPDVPPSTSVSKPISFPSLPKIDLKPNNFMLPLLGIFILLALLMGVIIFNSKATLTLFANPIPIKKSARVILDSQASSFDLAKGVVPVRKKTEDVTAKGTTEATGKRTTGEKAKGEITIFNKLEKTQTLPKNTLIKDADGHKFILSNVTVVAAAQPDLNAGVINLGQTKAIATAQDIGPAGNLNKDTQLIFADANSSSLLAKVSQPFTGGSSREISVVSPDDRTKLDKLLNDQIKKELDARVKEQKDAPDIIGSTLKIIKGKVDLSREVDEEATEVTGTITATVSVFYLEPQIKDSLINSYLRQDSSLANTNITNQDVILTFTNQTQDDKQATGTLNFSGDAVPTLLEDTIKSKLAFKSYSDLKKILQQLAPRVYDFKVDNTSKLVIFTSRLPLRAQNIKLVVTSSAKK